MKNVISYIEMPMKNVIKYAGGLEKTKKWIL